jgi:hypothetical protein
MARMCFILGLTAGEFTVAVVTSLVASVVFWLTFDFIPNRRAQKKIQPFVDYDLYLVYGKLFQFIETPFRPYENTPSQYQNEIFTGKITENDFRLFLSTKCLTEGHRSIDEKARMLLPIGNKLQTVKEEIEGIINQLYVFNHYLTADQILICRQILDKLNTYSYDWPAVHAERSGTITRCVNPTASYLSRMFNEVYALYLNLQNYLINSKKDGEEVFANYRILLESSKISYLFSQRKYKEVCQLVKKSGNKFAKPFLFRSLFLLGEIDQSKKEMIDYLHQSSLRLISIRNVLGEVINDEDMKRVLIAERSDEELNEMIQCIEKEKKNKRDYREFAEEMMSFYDNKTNRR